MLEHFDMWNTGPGAVRLAGGSDPKSATAVKPDGYRETSSKDALNA
jgi:hypothetical protein